MEKKLLSSYKIVVGILLYILLGEILTELIIFGWIEPILERNYSEDVVEQISEISQYLLLASLLIPITLFFIIFPVNRSNQHLHEMHRVAKQKSEALEKEIEERNKIETELIHSNEQLSLIAENLPVIPYICKGEGDFGAIFIGQPVQEVTGFQPEQFTSYSSFWADRIHPEDKEGVFSGLSTIFETGHHKHEYRWRHAEGHYLWFLDFFRLIPVEGKPSYIVGIWQDITELKRMEAQLRQSQKMESLGTLAGGIAHDFNNILLIMQGNLELVMEDLSEEQEDYQSLSKVYKAGKRATDLVRQILTFSRMESTKLGPLNLNTTIQDALEMVQATLPAYIDLRSNLSNPPIYILGDKTQVHQVLLNLCHNAYHALEHEDQGVIEVGLQQIEHFPPMWSVGKQPCALLTVQDSGKGIPTEHLEKVFDPFFTTKEVGKGTGLGLSVVYGIVESFGGQIEVDSQEGKGTCVSIFLPIIEGRTEQKTVEPTSLQKEEKRHILVVDDEPEVVRIYQTFLEKNGYAVTTKFNGKDALDLYKADPLRFDLILTDQAMPIMTGKHLSREILKIRPDIPIILSTGYSDLISEEDISAIGIRKYFIKPIELKQLEKMLQECLPSSPLEA